ncbi:MAG: hypothetical protein J6Y02_14830 [Pseudobutyrivibrio sp.]|nr:hypothetical protein [Pseudobutyrivibrio sp.]
MQKKSINSTTKARVIKVKSVSPPIKTDTSPTTEKKKVEFSKKWLIGCMTISCIFCIASFVFAWFDKNSVSEISIAIVQTLLGTSGVSFASYCVQNSVRAWTATKMQGNITTTEENPIDPNNQAMLEDPNAAMMANPIPQVDSNVEAEGFNDDYDYR